VGRCKRFEDKGLWLLFHRPIPFEGTRRVGEWTTTNARQKDFASKKSRTPNW
jgi:hypothetical protein